MTTRAGLFPAWLKYHRSRSCGRPSATLRSQVASRTTRCPRRHPPRLHHVRPVPSDRAVRSGPSGQIVLSVRSVRLFWSVRPVRPHGPSHSPSLVSSPLRVPSPAPAHALYLAPHHLPPLTQHYFQPSPVVRGARRHRAEILEQHVQFWGPTAAAHVPNRWSDPPNHRRHHRTAVYKFCRM